MCVCIRIYPFPAKADWTALFLLNHYWLALLDIEKHGASTSDRKNLISVKLLFVLARESALLFRNANILVVKACYPRSERKGKNSPSRSQEIRINVIGIIVSRRIIAAYERRR